MRGADSVIDVSLGQVVWKSIFFFIHSQKANDARKLRDLFVKARFARCRSRFVVPVILFEGKVKCKPKSGSYLLKKNSSMSFFPEVLIFQRVRFHKFQ